MKTDKELMAMQNKEYDKWLNKVYWQKYWVSIHMNTIYTNKKGEDCFRWEVTVHDRKNNNDDIVTIPFDDYDGAKNYYDGIKPFIENLREYDEKIQRVKDMKTKYCKIVRKYHKTKSVKPNISTVGEDWIVT